MFECFFASSSFILLQKRPLKNNFVTLSGNFVFHANAQMVQ